jgi:hypothetical protein
MKKLIRKILKEETEDNQMVKKGIDVLFSLVKKEYPFIVGWEKDGDWDESQYFLYVNMVVDYRKTKEYYNLPLKSYYKKYPNMLDEVINKKEEFPYPTSLLDFKGLSDEAYENYKKIKQSVDDNYELIPDDYKAHVEIENIFGKIMIVTKELGLHNCIFV